ncbi:MAG: SH3 domain-containing protein [Candidatus Nitrohelix vancouverensis]|uniref:SH3 domain-containing protein n=1 Tax=Candidatus Nitrohelix vancouverensis TaxID=2705534 RepID=A0A7T0C4G1_9BACT|nr:MAG: SH3 domain-containing protein [Candidatus Nitrohelix vancouverensis]
MRFSISVSFTFLVLFSLLAPSASQALCIKNSNANLRQGPGTHYQKLWEVYQYMPFKKLKKKGNWFNVKDVDGDVYWVHKKLVTESYHCAVIKNDKTNLRTGPSTDFAKVEWSPVDKFFSMKVLEIRGQWVHIVDSAGDKAWVYRPLVWIQ